LTAGIVLSLAPAASAQTGNDPEKLQRRLLVLEEQVRALQAEVAALKAASQTAPVSPAAVGPPAPSTPAALAAEPAGGEAQVFLLAERVQPGPGQYRRTLFGEEPPANELLFQVLFTIGAHGAHAF
jgi:hypothetical protein